MENGLQNVVQKQGRGGYMISEDARITFTIMGIFADRKEELFHRRKYRLHLAIAVVLCGVSIAGIISLIRTLIYVKAYNREAEKVNASNQSEFLRWRQETLAYRNDLVDEYDMVAVSTIYEYLASGRCYGLTGHEGAYNLYESEIRLGYIIGKLDNIDQNIYEMKHGQQMLYRAVQESRQSSERLLQQEIHNGKMLQEQTFIWGK